MSDPNSFSLFTYGSLMFSDVWQEVTGLSMQPVPARLHDHARYSVEDEDYPAVLRQPGQIVDGALYTGLSAAALAVLDRFEGPDYQRVTVQVLRTDGTQAEPIVFAPQSWPGAGQMVAAQLYLHLGQGVRTGQSWSVAGFRDAGMARFRREYIGFQREA